MPANLSPEYKKAEEQFRQAVTPEEKLAALEQMLSTIPKHKGTEKMQADLKTRIARLRRELSGSSKSGTKRADWYHIEKQGAGQVVVFGAPNTGKSALVQTLTNLPTTVAPYPFSTTIPAAGMMPYEDIQIQLVDTPPVVPDSPAWLFHICRTADLGVWLLDLSDDDILETTEKTRHILVTARVLPVAVQPLLADHSDLSTADAQISPATTTKSAPSASPFHPVIVCGSKADAPGAPERLALVKELLQEEKILPISAQTGLGLAELKDTLFKLLNIIRIYTKKPGKPPALDDPVILRRGATVMDAAESLHKEIAAHLQYARLWNSSGYNGQRVERNHVCQDKDILEFHT